MAKASESKPVSCRVSSSVSSGNVTCCSFAICLIASMIFNLTDMMARFLTDGFRYGGSMNTRLPWHSVYPTEVNGFLDNSDKIGPISAFSHEPVSPFPLAGEVALHRRLRSGKLSPFGQS